MTAWMATIRPERSDLAIAAGLLDACEALGGHPTGEVRLVSACLPACLLFSLFLECLWSLSRFPLLV